MVDWKSLPAFLAVARAGSLRGAAEQLDGTHATVRRQVEGLEAQLGVQLFRRSAGGLELSAAVEPRLSNSVSFPLSLAYTFTDAEFDSSFDSEFFGDVNEGDDLPYIARHQLYVEAGANIGRAAATVGANYVSELRDDPGSGAVAENERIDDRIVFDIAGSYALTDKFSLFARVDNVLDNQYAVSRRPFGLRPGVPRRIVGGARVSF